MRLTTETSYYDAEGNVLTYPAGTVLVDADGQDILDFLFTRDQEGDSIIESLYSGFTFVKFPDNVVRLVKEEYLDKGN